MDKPTVIVISSLVVDGSVGGRLQAFVLERFGFPTVLVPTVTLPWHPGEGAGRRLVPPPVGFARLVADIAGAPWRGQVGGILTGYLGHRRQAGPISELIRAVRAANPSLLALVDPVVGDAKGIYRPQAVIEAVRDLLLPLAGIVTPNRHELRHLYGDWPGDNRELARAARKIGAAETVVTSAFGGERQIGNLLVEPAAAHVALHDLLPEAPHGTGDLFAALYLAHRLDGEKPVEALRRASGATLQLAGRAAGGRVLPVVADQEALFDEGGSVAVEPATF